MKRTLLLALALGLLTASPEAAQVRARAPAASSGGGSVAVAGTLRIAGVVVDAMTGTAVGGAQVSIMSDGNAVEVTAGGDGRFVFDGLKVGKYPLYATARGYVQEGLNQHGAFLTGVAVRNGLDSEHVVFKLHPEAVLYGKVTDERGEAVRQAQVLLLSGDQGWGERRIGMRLQAPTNDLGEYRFAHLRAGKYYVAVQARPWYAQTGFRYMPEREPVRGQGGIDVFSGPRRTQPDSMLDVVYPLTFYPGVTDGGTANPVELSWGESEQADIGLQAVPSVHILVTNLPVDEKGGMNYGVGATGKVLGTMDYGLPVAGAQIAPGEFEIAGLPPGEATVHLYGNRRRAEDARTLEVNASEGGTVDARGAVPNVNVSGQVIFPPGTAAGIIGRLVLSDGIGRSFEAPLEKDGTFKIAGVHAGTYHLIVGAQGQRLYTSRVAATGARVSGRDVTIDGTGGDVSLTVTLGRGFGRVMGFAKQDGKPMEGVMVILAPESGQNLEQDTRIDQSDSDGTFTLAAIIPGKYVLMAIAEGWDLEWAKPGVLQPYWTKGQVVQIETDENKEVTLEVQGKATPAER